MKLTDALLGPVYAAVGEGQDHVEAFKAPPDFHWSAWSNDEVRMKSLMFVPLKRYWSDLPVERQLELKRALQYLLNADENLDRRASGRLGGIADACLSAYQDTIAPQDSNSFIRWMWDILFGPEDWHTDISRWEAITL